MNSSPRITDIALRDALTARAASGDPRALAAEVVTAVDVIPQRRRWDSRIRRSGSLVPVFVGIALISAALIGGALVGARLLRETSGTSGEIAFTSASWRWDNRVAAGDVAIVTVPAAGGDSHRLANVPGPAMPPTTTGNSVQVGPQVRWSPDGSRMAFRLYGDVPGLYVMNHDGSDLRRVAEATGFPDLGAYECCNSSFSWSPDGSRIAFISPLLPPWPPGSGPNGQLYVVDVETGVTRQVSDAANGSVAWSADGKKLAFGRSQPWESDLVVTNVDGTDEHSLRFSRADVGVNHPGPIDWSPDGSRIAFLQARFGETFSDDYIMVVKEDLTEPTEQAHWPTGCCYHGAFGGLLKWSPDGRWIATDVWMEEGTQVRVVSADVDSAQVDIPGQWFDWSPDASQLVIAAPGPDIPGAPSLHRSSSIYVVDADGTDRRWIADGDYPAWSP